MAPRIPRRTPSGDEGQLNIFPNGVLGFVAGAILDALDGATHGVFNLDDLAERMRGTETTATNANTTANAAAAGQSNLAVLYNFDVVANRVLYPAVAPFSFLDAGYAFSGTSVALLAPAGGFSGYDVQRVGPDFRVTPEEKIYVEWRQRRIGADYLARVNVAILDAAGTVIDSEPSIVAGTPALAVQPDATATDNTWVKYSGIVVVPVGAYTARPELRLQAAAGSTLTGSWAFDNVIVRRAVEADLTAIQAQLAGKADYSDIPTDVPLWVSANPTDDPVFPSSENVFHTNVNSSGNASETKIPGFTTTSGEMDLGYIRATRDRQYTQVGFMTSRGGLVGSGPLQLWVHLYKMNLSTGLITLLWNSGNVKSAVQSIGAGKVCRFNLGLTIEASKGDIYAVGLLQSANALNPSYNIYGKRIPYVDLPAGVYPRGRYSRASVGTTFPAPSTISSASMTWDDDVEPWFFLG